MFPLHQIAHVGVSQSRGLKLFGREVILEKFQPMSSRYLMVTDGQTDGQTDRQTKAISIPRYALVHRAVKNHYNICMREASNILFLACNKVQHVEDNAKQNESVVYRLARARSSAVAVIADRTACSSTIGQKQLLCDLIF